MVIIGQAVRDGGRGTDKTIQVRENKEEEGQDRDHRGKREKEEMFIT